MVTSSFLPGRGGIESHLAAVCDDLKPDLAVMAQSRRDGKPIPPDLGYETVGYPGPLFAPTPRAVQAVTAAARKLGVRKVLFGTPWPTGLIAPSLRDRGITYATLVHGSEFAVPVRTPIAGRRLEAMLAGADVIFPVSRFTEAAVQQRLRRRNLRVPGLHLLRPRVDLARFHPTDEAHGLRARLGLTGNKIILCFGRLVRRKGTHLVVRAMAEIRNQVPEAVLVVAGTGPESRPLQRLAARLKVPVLFAGRVPEGEAAAYYSMADVFCLAAYDRYGGLDTEGLGVVLLEAQACGTPCVAGRAGGTPEAVLHDETGFAVDARDPAELTTALLRLLTDGDLSSRMAASGRRFVEKEYGNRRIPDALITWLG